jgi:hypothetical protein
MVSVIMVLLVSIVLGVTVEVSDSVALSFSAPSPQAVKTPRAKTNNSFFIVRMFLV